MAFRFRRLYAHGAVRLRIALLLCVVIALASCGGGGAVSDAYKEGRTIYGDYCSVCHGSAGGGGVGPALDQVLVTWPDCDLHVEWVSIGSERWRAEYGDTYGATDKPIEAVMPAHDDRLSLDEIRKVSAFERIQYAGQDEAAAFAECQVDG